MNTVRACFNPRTASGVRGNFPDTANMPGNRFGKLKENAVVQWVVTAQCLFLPHRQLITEMQIFPRAIRHPDIRQRARADCFLANLPHISAHFHTSPGFCSKLLRPNWTRRMPSQALHTPSCFVLLIFFRNVCEYC